MEKEPKSKGHLFQEKSRRAFISNGVRGRKAALPPSYPGLSSFQDLSWEKLNLPAMVFTKVKTMEKVDPQVGKIGCKIGPCHLG
jgi:hypothetical protein